MQFIIEKKLGYLPESYQIEEYCYNHKTEKEKADYERKMHSKRAEQQNDMVGIPPSDTEGW